MTRPPRVAVDGCVAGVAEPVGHGLRQMAGFDARCSPGEARGAQRLDEGGAQLAGGVRRPLEVVRPVGDEPRVGRPNVGGVEVGDDEHGVVGRDAEQGRHRHERVRDRPVLVGCLEAAEGRERLGVRQHCLCVADCVERGAEVLEAHSASLAESRFNSKRGAA